MKRQITSELNLICLLLLSVTVFLALFPIVTNAGFGVTPPYVKNSELTRNSIYEQRIMLVRGNPSFDALAEITVDVPGANEWITIEPSEEVLLAEGERLTPITVRILVPNKAPFDDYRGTIRVQTRAVSEEDRGRGTVSIALGARINFDISVIDRVIKKFEIQRVRISDFNEGRKVRWLEYPGKMTFTMTLQNTGNVPVAPDRVVVDIYDSSGKDLLERTEHTNKIKRVDPFKTEEVYAELPSHLPPGSYRGHFSIYNGDEVVRSGELSFGIRPAGTIEGDTGYGFWGLSLWHKTTIVGPIVILILILVSLILYFSKRTRLILLRGLRSWRALYRVPLNKVLFLVNLISRGFTRRRFSRD